MRIHSYSLTYIHFNLDSFTIIRIYNSHWSVSINIRGMIWGSAPPSLKGHTNIYIYIYIYILGATLCTYIRRAHCPILRHVLPHTATYCRPLLRPLPHTATRTAAHCRTLPHCWTATHCRAHCRILLQALLTNYRAHCHTLLPLALPHTAALSGSRTIHIKFI
jgi:hypothetical protein